MPRGLLLSFGWFQGGIKDGIKYFFIQFGEDRCSNEFLVNGIGYSQIVGYFEFSTKEDFQSMNHVVYFCKFKLLGIDVNLNHENDLYWMWAPLMTWS